MRRIALLASVMVATLTSGTALANQTIKIGFARFTSDLQKVTSSGPAFALIQSFQPIPFAAMEISAFEGGYNKLADPDASERTGLFRLGSSTSIKLILPVLPVVHPFAGVGIGFGYVLVQGGQSSSLPIPVPGQPGEKYSNGLLVDLPIAGGIDFEISKLTLGVRATYHYPLYQQFVTNTNAKVDFLELSGTIGFSLF